MHGTLPEKYWSRLFLGERWPVKCSKELGDIACELKTSVNWILLFLRVEKISVSVVNSWDLWMDFNSYSPGRERNTFRIIETGIWGTHCMKCHPCPWPPREAVELNSHPSHTSPLQQVEESHQGQYKTWNTVLWTQGWPPLQFFTHLCPPESSIL